MNRKSTVVLIICVIFLIAAGCLTAKAAPRIGPLGDYHFERYIGKSAEKTLSMPANLAVDPQGNVYISDVISGSIKVYDPKGTFRFSFGSLIGDNPGEPSRFTPPRDMIPIPGLPIAADGHFIYVSDPQAHRIQKFTAEGKYISDVKKVDPEGGRWNFPVSIAVDKDGNLYVLDSAMDDDSPTDKPSSSWVIKLNSSGEYLLMWQCDHTSTALALTPEGGVIFPSGEAFASDGPKRPKIYVPQTIYKGPFITAASDSKGRFYITSTSGGNGEAVRLDRNGNNPKQLVLPKPEKDRAIPDESDMGPSPVQVVIGPKDDAYVLDLTSQCVYKFSGDSAPQLVVGGPSEPGQLKAPEDAAVDSKGNIWIADSGNASVQEFDKTGKFLKRVKTVGAPCGLAFDDSGNLYVSIREPGVIAKYDPNGELDKKFMDNLAEMAVSGHGNAMPTWAGALRIHGQRIFVCNQEQVEVYDLVGKHICTMKREQMHEQMSVEAIAPSDSGQLYVADGAFQKIQVFDNKCTFVKVIQPGGPSLRIETGEWDSTGIAVVQDGILLLDMDGRLRLIGMDGKLISAVPDAVTAGAGLSNPVPRLLTVSPDGKIIITDTFNNRVVVLARNPKSSGQAPSSAPVKGQKAAGMTIQPGKYQLEWTVPDMAADFDPDYPYSSEADNRYFFVLKPVGASGGKKPSGLKSSDALIGSGGGMSLILDQSKGTGTHYDTAYISANADDISKMTRVSLKPVPLRGNEVGTKLSMSNAPGTLSTTILVGKPGARVTKTAALDGLRIDLHQNEKGMPLNDVEVTLRGGWYGKIKTSSGELQVHPIDGNANGVYGDKWQPGTKDCEECGCGDYISFPSPQSRRGNVVGLAAVDQIADKLYLIDVSPIGDSLEIRPFTGDTGFLNAVAVDGKGNPARCENPIFTGTNGDFSLADGQPATAPVGSYRCLALIGATSADGQAEGIYVVKQKLLPLAKGKTVKFTMGGPIRIQWIHDTDVIQAKSGEEKRIEMRVYVGEDVMHYAEPSRFEAVVIDSQGKQADKMFITNIREEVDCLQAFTLQNTLKPGTYTIEVRLDPTPYQPPVIAKKKLIVK